jgi:hypothetical protein
VRLIERLTARVRTHTHTQAIRARVFATLRESGRDAAADDAVRTEEATAALRVAADAAHRIFDAMCSVSELASDDLASDDDAHAMPSSHIGAMRVGVSVTRLMLFLLSLSYTTARAQSQVASGKETRVRIDAAPSTSMQDVISSPLSSPVRAGQGKTLSPSRAPRSPTKLAASMSLRRSVSGHFSDALHAVDGASAAAAAAVNSDSVFGAFLLHHWDVVVHACSMDADARKGRVETLTRRECDGLGFLFETRDIDGTRTALSALVCAEGEDEVSVNVVRDWIVRHVADGADDAPGSPKARGAEATSSMSAVQAIAALTLVGDDVKASASAVPDFSVNAEGAKTLVAIDGAYRTTVVRNQGMRDTRIASGLNACCSTTPKNLPVFGSPRYASSTPCAEITSCSDSVIYLLEPYHYVSISGCVDCTIVVGACARSLRMEQCERVTLMCATKRIAVRSCFECTFHLGIANQPVFIGDNRKCMLAPYNTYYEHLLEHLSAARIDPSMCNAWDRPVIIGADVTIKDQQSTWKQSGVVRISSGVSLISPDAFTPFIVPFRESASREDDAVGATTQANPFETPPSYVAALDVKMQRVNDIRTRVRDSSLSDIKRSELQGAIQAHFKEWLGASGNSRQIFDLSAIERDEMRAANSG